MKTLCFAAVLALFSLAKAAHAQAPATSFAELPSLLKAGDTVSVTTEAGDVITGEIEYVSDTILLLNRPRANLQLAAHDVRRIDRLTPNKLKGALFGLALGGAFGAFAGWADNCQALGCIRRSFLVPGLAAEFGLMGMGLGAAVGAIKRTPHVVFEKAQRDSARAAVAPFLSRERAGLRIQVTW